MSLLLQPSDRLFVLTGAGISAESGLATFRGKGGLWEGNRAVDLATPEAFARNPELVWRFYSMRRDRHAECKPNPGHVALAQLEKKLGERMLICTQNVDSLHEAAGSTRVLHMHGKLIESRCSNPQCASERFEDDIVRVDMREQVITVPPQKLITKDNVTVEVDAVVYYKVIDPVKRSEERR